MEQTLKVDLYDLCDKCPWHKEASATYNEAKEHDKRKQQLIFNTNFKHEELEADAYNRGKRVGYKEGKEEMATTAANGVRSIMDVIRED